MAITAKKTVIIVVLLPSAGVLFLLMIPLALMVLLFSVPAASDLTPQPSDVLPSQGLPSAYVQQAAQYAAGVVPLQYLAGEVQTESGWDPTVNANANSPDSHAAGLMQFEPETWSGSNNPNATIVEPDTDAGRIQSYGGFGKDADNVWEPPGTPAEEDLQWLQETSRPAESGYVPYASPYDPYDALMSGVGYLYKLYGQYGGWVGASHYYYGGEDWLNYVHKVWGYTYDYIADTSPLTTTNGGTPVYFFLGAVPFWVSPDASSGFDLHATVGNTAVLRPPGKGRHMSTTAFRRMIEDEFVTSVPVIAPADGDALWRPQDDGSVRIWLPLPEGNSLELTAGQAVAWQFPRYGGSCSVKAGEVVGFVNLLAGLSVDQDPKVLYPSLGVTGYWMNVMQREPEYDPYASLSPEFPIGNDPWR